jgi:hypothetical protein
MGFGRADKEKLPPSTAIRLACPVCAYGFEQAVVGLIVFSAGAEQFPRSVVVEMSALKG